MVIASLIISILSLCIALFSIFRNKVDETIVEEEKEKIKQEAVADLISSYLYGDE